MLLQRYPKSGHQVSTGKHTISVCTFPYRPYKFLLSNPTGKMLALVWYVISWDTNAELIHGECLSVYRTFHCFKTFYNTTDLTFHSNKIISFFTYQGTKWYCTDNQNLAIRWALANTQSVYALFLTNHANFYFRIPLARCWLSSGMWNLGIPMLNWSTVNASQCIEHSTALTHSTIQQIWPSTGTK